MAGHLLLVVLMYLFSDLRAQALLAPNLTVNPPVITETDSVTLNCQTPSSVSVSQCYFNIVSGEPAKSFSCLKTLRGTELLKITHQTSPAEVKVTCFYLKGSQSPDSDISSITIRTSLPPKLTVNPPVIKETDSVTLNCQTPSSVSVSKCFFNILSGGNIGDSSCLQTLTGTELLLKMTLRTQSSSAELQVMCFYTVKLGETDSPSPLSDTSSITIHNILEKESHKTQTLSTSTMLTSTMTTGQTVGTPHTSTPVTPAKQTSAGWPVETPSNTDLISTILSSEKPGSSVSTPLKTASEMWMWKLIAVVTGCGVIVGIILLVSAICQNRKRTGSEQVRRQGPQKENYDVYHMYSTISEEPAASALNDMEYSTVQAH